MPNWGAYDDLVSEHFTVKECLWLPTWNRLAEEKDGLDSRVRLALVDFVAGPLESLRAALGKPFNIHVMYRPVAYNQQIGGALHSAHQCLGDWAACDFDIPGEDCDTTRQTIVNGMMLDTFGLRMEQNPGAPWLHIDSHPVLTARFFKP